MTTVHLVLPLNPQELPTTSAAIFVGNLNAQIVATEEILAVQPRSVVDRKRLAGLYKMRADCRDDIDGYQKAIDLLSDGAAGSPHEDAEALLLRAQLELSVHRLARSQTDLDRARSLGADAGAVSAIQIELDWNAGRYDEAVPAIRKAAAERPSTHTLARLAELEHRLGDDGRARDRYARAESCVRDTLPLTVAWLNLQRGIHAAETGDLEQAVVFLEEAVRRLPHYFAARECLARVTHQLGREDESVSLYEALAEESANPEHWSHLVAVYRPGHPRRDGTLLRARDAWDRLLARYPEAMYWHAAEFYLEYLGAPAYAAELLQKNSVLRPNADSWWALAEAQAAGGQQSAAEYSRRTAEEAHARLTKAACS